MLAALLTRLRHFSLDGIRQDARYALRAMRKKPAFTTLAIVTLALGIGVNTTSVAVAYGLLVRPLPYHDSSRVVVLNLIFPDGGDLGFSPATPPGLAPAAAHGRIGGGLLPARGHASLERWQPRRAGGVRHR